MTWYDLIGKVDEFWMTVDGHWTDAIIHICSLLILRRNVFLEEQLVKEYICSSSTPLFQSPTTWIEETNPETLPDWSSMNSSLPDLISSDFSFKLSDKTISWRITSSWITWSIHWGLRQDRCCHPTLQISWRKAWDVCLAHTIHGTGYIYLQL